MAEGKLDRTLNLSTDESLRSKGSLSVGLDDEKASLGFVDEFKDQQSSENIPLSPQWLYAKPTEIKDGRPQNLPEVPQENKRERRRSTLETENSLSTRRWREEERETGLLGRRGDRPKKESDPPARNPNPSNSTKWSSRWGPDDHRERETQTRLDKKLVDVPEKEQHETNPNPSSNPSTEKFTPRPLSEIDSRDKWRPRHRHEGPVATYRVAPGFGSERGGGARQEPIANTGFAAGRGRSSSNLGHVGPIGADPFGRGGGDKVGKISFRYPRGRLLDIYRKNRLVRGNYEDVHVGFEAVPCVTLPSEVSPLAFLAPDDEEKVTLEEIYKGKLTSSGTDPLKKNDSSCIESTFLALGEEKYTLPTALGISAPELDANQHALNIGFVEDTFPEFTEKPKMSKAEAQDVAFFESSVNLPDDSSSLFDTPFVHDKPAYLGKSPSPPMEEVSLYYQDPQGGIQGPFLGIDIVSWYQEGYFGLDLPVCPTDAPEGTPYRPLGEVMPQLRQKLQSVEVPELVPFVSNSEAEVAKPLVGSLQHNNNKSKNKNELAADGSEVPFEGGSVGWVPQPNQVDSVTASRFEEQWPQGASTGMDNEEVIYVGRPNSRMGTSQAIKQTSDDTDLPLWATSDEPPYNAMSEMGDSSQTSSQHNLQVPRSGTPSNDNINPLGLLWSELESSQSKQPLSSNLPPNYLKPDPLMDLMDSNLQPRMHHNELELSHFTMEEQLLSEQLHRQQLQQLQQEQLFARAHGGRSQASELDQLFKLQYELEQQRKLQLQQERLQQERLQQERLQQERLQHERLQQERLLQERARREQMIIRQQQIQEQLLLEQMLQQQLQQERLQEQQMLREQQFLNELQRAQHIQRQQQDAAIEQLIQAKFGPASQRQMVSPSIEQQLLLGLQQRDPIQAQKLALALRQQQEQQRLEEEIMLRGVRPTGPSAHHVPGLNRTSSSRLSQLERSLSLHDQLQSMERSMSMNAGLNAPSPRNAEFTQTLAQLELQERQLRERQLQERQQRSMFGSHGGPLDQFWPDPNSNPGAAQLERSLIESHLSHQLQLEAENKMRIRKPGSGLEDAHLWGPQEGLNDVMYHQNMPLQSPHGSFKDSSLIFNPNPSPNTNSVISMEAMQSGIRPGSSSGPGSFVDKDLFGNRGKFQNEEMGNPNPNSVPSSDPQCFDSFGEAVIKTDQEPVRAPTPARHASFGSSDDAIFSMGEDSTAFSEEIVDSRPRVMSRTDSRTGGSVKINEADNQHQAAPRPPSRPTSADASRQEGRGGLNRSETQASSKKEIRLLRPPSSSSGELDTSGPTFIEMLKSTKKPPQPASQLDDEAGPGGKGAKKKGKKGRQIDPSLLGFKVHSNRIMMGEIHRPDE